MISITNSVHNLSRFYFHHSIYDLMNFRFWVHKIDLYQKQVNIKTSDVYEVVRKVFKQYSYVDFRDPLLSSCNSEIHIKVNRSIGGCIQKFPDWSPGARTANGTALCH
jgi:hypothetical protein